MPPLADGISRVRIRPLALDLGGVTPLGSPGAYEVTWDSTQAGLWHQVYVNGQPAGVTAGPEDRRLVVLGPVGRRGCEGLVYVEVVAVNAADRQSDFSAELSGFSPACGLKVRLTWEAGLYLDEDLESFSLFADNRTGTVDYSTPLSEVPIPAVVAGALPWGFGCGGYGVGGYGLSAACYEWTIENLQPGTWRMAVLAADIAGNRLATAAEVVVDVAPVPRPAGNFRVASYSAPSRTATLAWEPSPDV
jgi:hypothetical protein